MSRIGISGRNGIQAGSRSGRAAARTLAASSAQATRAGEDGGASRTAALEATPAELVVHNLGRVIRWARLRSFDQIHERAGVDVDRSGIIILAALHRLGPMRMSDLAADIGLDRSTISRQVAAVVRDGYVQKTDDADDARASVLSLTARGQAARKKLADAWHDIVIGLLEDWSPDEQAELGHLLGKLVDPMGTGHD